MCKEISDEIIKTLHQQKREFKFICNCIIFQKGNAELYFTSTCLCNLSIDAAITVKYENKELHCCVCLFGVTPELI